MTIFSLRRFAALFALLFSASTRVAHAEIIRSFESDVTLNADASLDVTETIEMDFQGARRHGIYRKIPISYPRAGKTCKLDWKVKSVTMDGKKATVLTTHPGPDISLRIGDADKTNHRHSPLRVELRSARRRQLFRWEAGSLLERDRQRLEVRDAKSDGAFSSAARRLRKKTARRMFRGRARQHEAQQNRARKKQPDFSRRQIGRLATN